MEILWSTGTRLECQKCGSSFLEGMASGTQIVDCADGVITILNDHYRGYLTFTCPNPACRSEFNLIRVAVHCPGCNKSYLTFFYSGLRRCGSVGSCVFCSYPDPIYTINTITDARNIEVTLPQGSSDFQEVDSLGEVVSKRRMTRRQKRFCLVTAVAFPCLLFVPVFALLGLQDDSGWSHAARNAALLVGALCGFGAGVFGLMILPWLVLRGAYRSVFRAYASETTSAAQRNWATFRFAAVLCALAAPVSAGIGIAGSALSSEGILRSKTDSFIGGGAVFLFGYGLLFYLIWSALSRFQMPTKKRTFWGVFCIGIPFLLSLIVTFIILGPYQTSVGLAGGVASALIVLVFQGATASRPT